MIDQDIQEQIITLAVEIEQRQAVNHDDLWIPELIKRRAEMIKRSTANITAHIGDQISQLAGKPVAEINVDKSTGIHYGTIYGNDISSYALDDLFSGDWQDLTYEQYVSDIKSTLAAAIDECKEQANLVEIVEIKRILTSYMRDTLWRAELIDDLAGVIFADLEMSTADLVEFAWQEIEQDINDHYEPDSTEYAYTGDGYTVFYNSGDNSMIVEKSPYYTMAGGCSPCFINGGYLGKSGDVKTYALDYDWFDGDNPSPASVIYRVDTGEEIHRPADQTATFCQSIARAMACTHAP